MSYVITEVRKTDRFLLKYVDRLLASEGLDRDANLDYIAAMLDDDGDVIATGSCFANTLRCFAVSRDHQGEGLLNEIIGHLIENRFSKGMMHLFLYTKITTGKFFRDLGFHEIAHVDGTLVFMENRRDGFGKYLDSLKADRKPGKSGAIVMNANPFTLGHRYLVETAAAQCDTLHLFVLSEDASLFPAKVRQRLVREGVADLPNVIVHESGPYMISSATFPSYFLRDAEKVIDGHAKLDLAVFRRIAEVLDIKVRFVGEEPFSTVTRQYNEVMQKMLPEGGIDCVIIPRKALSDTPISASEVRRRIHDGEIDDAAELLPPTTLAWLKSDEAKPVIERIRKAEGVVHY